VAEEQYLNIEHGQWFWKKEELATELSKVMRKNPKHVGTQG
jgi:hypothetical protein